MKRHLRWGILAGLMMAVQPMAAPVAKKRVVAPVPGPAPVPVIQKIQVAGNKRIEADAITEKMAIKTGSAPTREQVAADIHSIFDLGFFEDVRFEEDQGTLTVTVRERPVVTDITYEGADEFETKDLEEATNLKPFNVLNLSRIRQAQNAIAHKYEEKGYYLAKADYVLKPVAGRSGEVQLLFKITENERVRIRKIFFLGNKVFSSGELKKIMLTTEGHVFSWATSGGVYREAAFERDLSALAFFYSDSGYIEAKFAKPRVTLSQDRLYVDVFIDVDEGKQYRLGDVGFRGDLLFTSEELRESFALKLGDVFSTGKLQEQVLKLTDKYGDQGYAFANVIPRTSVREGTDIVDLNFDIEKGEKVYWGKISVTGNAKTHDKVVRRELPFAEGELYNATKRKKGVDRVRRLGFFGNDVSFLTSSPPGTNNVLNLEINVSEKPTGSLNVNMGWSSVQNFVFGAQVTQANWMGLGQQLSFQMQWTQGNQQSFNLGWTDPKIFDTEWLAGVDVYYQHNPVGSTSTTDWYVNNLKGVSFKLGRELIENLSLYGTYKLENSEFRDAINPAIFSEPSDEDTIVSSITGTLDWDTRNNRLDASGGEHFQLSGEFAGLGGRVFQKYLASAKFYRNLGWKFVYRTNFEMGAIANALTDSPVPTSERFMMGGIFNLRGYPQNSISPAVRVANLRKNKDGSSQDPDGGLTKVPIGGSYKVLTMHEVEFPLIPDADIRAVVFFDAGNTWTDFSTLSPSLYSDVGWGIRWYSPLGPLRFEWGYPLSRLPNAPVPNFNFIIAPAF